jgi:hypothetical protein
MFALTRSGKAIPRAAAARSRARWTTRVSGTAYPSAAISESWRALELSMAMVSAPFSTVAPRRRQWSRRAPA